MYIAFKKRYKSSIFFITLFFFSSVGIAFTPLDPFLWPDPNYKPKFDLIQFKHFKKPKGAYSSDESLAKRITFDGSPSKRRFKISLDSLNMQKEFKVLNMFPEFTLDILMKDSKSIPLNQSVRSSFNLHWDIQFGIGESWTTDLGNTRSSIPFALVQKNQNCVHNGVMVFDFDFEGNMSNIVYQIASETCSYFKFDLIGLLEINSITDIEFLEEDHHNSLKHASTFAPLTSINKLEQKKNFGSSKEVSPDHLSVYGYYDGEIHYRSSCKTRSGNYPYCGELLLPSFSLSKSLVATVSLALLERDYPNVMNEKIQEFVPECKQKKWANVQFKHALNMSTGHYYDKKWYSEDWYLNDKGFSLNYTHKDRIKFACSVFKKKSDPGLKLSYHSSDTYILAVALNNFYKSKTGRDSDVYTDLVLPLWKELNLSQSTHEIRRSIDNIRQPYMEYGMFLTSDDLVKIGNFLLKDNDLTQSAVMSDALQKNKNNRGLAAIDNILFYNNGFWSKRFNGPSLGCNEDIWIPFMSGFGGITVALLPNSSIYYYFSDNQEFAWDRAVNASNKMKPFCKTD